MSVEEAVLQMNLLGHDFFVFRDQDNDEKYAIVYRRKSGGYGLIEDEK
jgi:putative sigma-54 modulation protein